MLQLAGLAVQLMNLPRLPFPLFGKVELRLIELIRAQSVELHSPSIFGASIFPSVPEFKVGF